MLRTIKLELIDCVGTLSDQATAGLWDWYRARPPGEVAHRLQAVQEQLDEAATIARQLPEEEASALEGVRPAVQRAEGFLATLNGRDLPRQDPYPPAEVIPALEQASVLIVGAWQQLAKRAPLSPFARTTEFHVTQVDAAAAAEFEAALHLDPGEMGDQMRHPPPRVSAATVGEGLAVRRALIDGDPTLFTVLNIGTEWRVDGIVLQGPGVAMVRGKRRRWLQLDPQEVPHSQDELQRISARVLEAWWEAGH